LSLTHAAAAYVVIVRALTPGSVKMAKYKPKLSRETRRAAVYAAVQHNRGCVHTAAKITGETVRYVIATLDRYNKLNKFKDRKPSGRPKALSKQQVDTAAVLLAEVNNAAQVTRIMVQQHGASPSLAPTTVKRSMKGIMEAVRPQKQPLLTKRNMTRRVGFAQQVLRSGASGDSHTAMDSSYFTLNGSNPNGKVWTKVGVKPRKTKPNKSQQLHVYGGICVHGKTRLHYVSGTTWVHNNYKNSRGEKLHGVGGEEFTKLLLEQLAPEAQQLFDQAGAGKTTLLLDNAPGHTAGITQRAIRQNNISVEPGWPANSPDLNPIENIWGMMKLVVYRKQYNNLDELKAAVEAEWERIPVATLRNCMLSIPRRLAKCMKLKGRYTGY
jgi:transposase